MSHELEQRPDGSFSYVGAREDAWHKLGKTYYDRTTLTVAEVLEDLDAGEIISTPVECWVNGPNGPTLVAEPSKKMNIRVRKSGEMISLGIIGTDYTVVDEAKAFGFIDDVIDSGEANVVSAGLTFGGKRAFCCFKLPEAIMIGGVDRTDMYAMITTSHDGSTALVGAITPIRTVCQNTVTLGLQMAARTWKVRHTSDMKLRVQEARTALDIAYKYADAWSLAANELLDVKVSNGKFDQIISQMFGPGEEPSKVAATNWEKKRGTLIDLFAKADTQDAIRNTAWGAFNAIVEYQDWVRPVRGADDVIAAQFERSVTEDSKWKDTIHADVRRMVGLPDLVAA